MRKYIVIPIFLATALLLISCANSSENVKHYGVAASTPGYTTLSAMEDKNSFIELY